MAKKWLAVSLCLLCAWVALLSASLAEARSATLAEVTAQLEAYQAKDFRGVTAGGNEEAFRSLVEQALCLCEQEAVDPPHGVYLSLGASPRGEFASLPLVNPAN